MVRALTIRNRDQRKLISYRSKADVELAPDAQGSLTSIVSYEPLFSASWLFVGNLGGKQLAAARRKTEISSELDWLLLLADLD